MTLLRRFSRPEALVVVGGLLWIWATALSNIGIFAFDDYWAGIVLYLPASRHSVKEIVDAAEIRNPLSNLFLFGLVKVGDLFGFKQPFAQYRFLLFTLATFSYSVFQISIQLLFPPKAPENDQVRFVARLLFAFYFFVPFVYSRSMIESLCSPWLFASAVAAQLYFDRKRCFYLLLSLAFIVTASMFRVQAGICAVALFALPFLCRQRKDLLPLTLSSLVFFIGAGIPDLILRGSLHKSLIAYVGYNLKYADSYGIPPFWSFLSTLFLLTLPPALVVKLDWKKVKETFGRFLPMVLFFGIFVFSHTMTKHKEERFLIPILPVFLLLLALWIDLMLKAGVGRWRWWYAGTINTAALILASFQTAQSNVLDFAKHLDRTPQITRVLSADVSLRHLFPVAFIGHPVRLDTMTEKAVLDLARDLSCADIVTSSTASLDVSLEKEYHLEFSGRFEPGFLEGLAVRFNPRQNARRGAFSAYRKKNCG